MISKILVAYDGSDGAGRALEMALEIANICGAEITAISVTDKLPRFSATLDEVQGVMEFNTDHFGRLLERAQNMAKEKGINLNTIMRSGCPANTIVEEVNQHGYDLIVLGNSGASGIWSTLAGTAERVNRHASCPVFITR